MVIKIYVVNIHILTLELAKYEDLDKENMSDSYFFPPLFVYMSVL